MATLSSTNLLREVFNDGAVRALAARLHRISPRFDALAFTALVVPKLSSRGFADRCALIADALEAHLPSSYREAVAVLLDALGPELPEPGVTVWDSFIVMPQCEVVARRAREDVGLALRALYEMTKRFSAEFHLRTLLEIDHVRTMQELERWCEDGSPHVRRLVSEGTRPRLPMAPHIARFREDPTPVLGLLERLRDDESLYVRRSVANNLNDIAKDHPALVLRTLRAWSRDASPRVRWVIRRAARTLVRDGDAAALTLLGCRVPAPVAVGRLRVPERRCATGGYFAFGCELRSTSTRSEPLVIDYVVQARTTNGRVKRRVYRPRLIALPAGGVKALAVRHPLRATSRGPIALGRYELHLRVNGQVQRSTWFTVL